VEGGEKMQQCCCHMGRQEQQWMKILGESVLEKRGMALTRWRAGVVDARDKWSENIGRKLVGIRFFLEIPEGTVASKRGVN